MGTEYVTSCEREGYKKDEIEHLPEKKETTVNRW